MVDEYGLQGAVGEEEVLLLTAKAADDGIGLLEQQEDCPGLPGVWAPAWNGENEVTGGDVIIAFLDEIERVETAAGEKIVDEILVDGAEATNEQPTLVVAAASAGGGEDATEFIPGDAVSEFPAEGAEDGMGGSGGTATGVLERLGGEERGEEGPLGGGEPAEFVEIFHKI